MKALPLFCALASLMSIVSAEEKATVPPVLLPDSSINQKEALKKLPRLGMTPYQLQALWGDNSTQNEGHVTWENIGGLNLIVYFNPTFYGEEGKQGIDWGLSRSVAINCSTTDKSLLTEEEIFKTAESLLPGFTFQRPDPQNKTVSEFECESIDQGKTYKLSFRRDGTDFQIEFTSSPRIIKIETDKL